MTFPTLPSSLQLASVKDAHNQGALVQILGEASTAHAHYDADLQAGGVVIRPCHLVVVDSARQPWEIIWRIGTRGIVCTLDEEAITLDLGHQSVTLLLNDCRPDEEKLKNPLTVGMEVLLRGKLDRACIVDTFLNGELAHPERLKTHLSEIIARTSP